jgi:trimeric autotransporter adhesin
MNKSNLLRIALLAFALWTLAIGLETCEASERITADLTIIAATTNGMTLTVNGDVRTWTNSVVTASTQILTNAAIGGVTTNLYNHVVSYPFTGIYPIWVATNQLRFVGIAGSPLTASIAGSWATVSLSTQQVTELRAVRVPISGEPTASARTNTASELVSGISDYSTNSFAAASTAVANLMNLSTDQTAAGVKTFGTTHHTGILNIDPSASIIFATNGAAVFGEGAAVFFSTNVLIYDVTLNAKWRFNSIEATNSITTFSDITNKITALKAASSSFTGTNTFTQITNSVWVAGTITNATIYGTAGTITNGTYIAPVLTNALNKGAAFQSYYDTNTSTLQLGKTALASGTDAVALGNTPTASGARSIAIGNATATHADAVAIGGATTTAANEIRLGGGSQNLATPNNAYIGGNMFVGHANSPTFPTGLAKGLVFTNGTAASADPANGVALWSDAGLLQYRTSTSSEGSGVVNNIHNRPTSAIGSGSDYSFAGTSYVRVDFGGTDPEVTLPSGGTYFVTALVQIQNGATANDVYSAKLYNSTDAADVTSSEETISNLPISGSGVGQGIIPLQSIVTVTSSKVLQIYAKNATAARGSVTAANTKIIAIRLY